MWSTYKWTTEDWEQFWKEVLEAANEEDKKQLQEWHDQRHKDLEKRHIRRIINF